MTNEQLEEISRKLDRIIDLLESQQTVYPPINLPAPPIRKEPREPLPYEWTPPYHTGTPTGWPNTTTAPEITIASGNTK